MSTIPDVPEAVGAAPEPGGESPRQEMQLILPSPEDAVATAMARRGILTCQPGQRIARQVEAPGASPRNPKQVLLSELRLGKHVVWDAKLAAYVSYVAGHVTLHQGKLDVDEVLDLAEDIDGVNGAVTYNGPLVVRHNVLDLAVLRASGAITVHGSIEAAEVHAGGDLHVYHGICGKEKGRVSARGRITTRFLTNAHVTAGGDMIIANEIVNCHLTCGGILKVEHGSILAGQATAQGGILCHTAGSEVGVKTILGVGLAQERYAAIEKALNAAEHSRQAAREIRDAVEPLMARAKTLTAAQKEKATELLFAADEAEALANKELAALEQTKMALQACISAKITVAGVLHPGVIVRFPIAEALVTVAMRGPLEIVLSTRGGETHIAVVDRCRNTSVPLHSLPSTGGVADIARRILAGGSGVH